VANGDDISTWDGARALIEQAVEVFGGLDVVVNNAGILRDRMLVNMSEEEWDSVIRVHLKGTFAVSRHAAAYWRERSKAGERNDARIINTTSVSGLYGNIGQANYGAAKAGIAGLTIIAARELARYGVTVNAIAPAALTRMTEDLPIADEVKASLDPRRVAPVCVWLASTLSCDVTEQIIEVSGTTLAIAEGWHRGPTAAPVVDPAEVDAAVRKLLAGARPHTNMAEVTSKRKD
jgi:NAD(P)-dependent dehydrogenase (short-subunit alcohol dehydrogenase family)